MQSALVHGSRKAHVLSYSILSYKGIYLPCLVLKTFIKSNVIIMQRVCGKVPTTAERPLDSPF